MNKFEKQTNWQNDEEKRITSPSKFIQNIFDTEQTNILYLDTKNRIVKCMGLSAEASVEKLTIKTLFEGSKNTNTASIALYIPRELGEFEKAHIRMLEEDMESFTALSLLEVLQRPDEDDKTFYSSYKQTCRLYEDMCRDEFDNTHDLVELQPYVDLGKDAAYRKQQKKAFTEQVETLYPNLSLEQVDKIVTVCRSLTNQVQEHFICFDETADELVPRLIAKGTINSAVLSPKDVFNCTEGTQGMIFMHNHPSGVPNHSSDDVRTTQRFMKLARELELHVYDHLIVGETQLWSMADNCVELEGKMDKHVLTFNQDDDLESFCDVNRDKTREKGEQR